MDTQVPRVPTNPRLLLLTKQFFIEAERAAGLGDSFSAMKAVLFLDLAVEQMLNLLLIDLGTGEESQKADDLKWRQLWHEAQSVAEKAGIHGPIPHFKELGRLRRVRNLVQHHAITPDPIDATRFVSSTNNMLSYCFDRVYGRRFETYHVWEEVRNAHIQRLLREASEAVELGAASVAVAGVRLAFKRIVEAVRSESQGQYDHLARIEREGRWEKGWERAVGPLAEAIRELREDSVVANLGVSMAKTGKFREIETHMGVAETMGGVWHIEHHRDLSETAYKRDAEFAIEYLTTLTLLAQDAYPSALESIEIPIPLSEQPVCRELGIKIDVADRPLDADSQSNLSSEDQVPESE
jgi:hypothetical protein